MSGQKDVVKAGRFEYEPKRLNALTEPGAKQYAFKQLGKFQTRRGWTINSETKWFDPVEGAEDMLREIYLTLDMRMFAIFASDKRGVIPDVETLMDLAENDMDAFKALYSAAVEANPSLSDGSEKEGKADPN